MYNPRIPIFSNCSRGPLITPVIVNSSWQEDIWTGQNYKLCSTGDKEEGLYKKKQSVEF